MIGHVLVFDAGLGRGDGQHVTTALSNLTLAFEIMGLQASPIVLKVILSTRSPNGIAVGQTWVTAGFLGALIAFAVPLVGLAGLVDHNLSLERLFLHMQDISPWFSSWVVIGTSSAVLLLSSLSLFATAEMFVRHIYKPYFNSRLSKSNTVVLTQIFIAVSAVVLVLLQNLAPVTLSALAGLALPMAFQLWTPLLGVTWLGWITPAAAVTGVGFGIAGVFLTEPFGYQVLSFFGLELPWGRWPWTLHSSAWGMAANIAAVLIISAITRGRPRSVEAQDIRRLLASAWASSGALDGMRSAAWSVALIWFFFAVGPGLIFGSYLFGPTLDNAVSWPINMPSLWAWMICAWIAGVGLIWFLSYKMAMASPVRGEIPAYVPVLQLHRDQTDFEAERSRQFLIVASAVVVLLIFIAFSFGS
jgi:SSS family solute:Na+ symporter